MPDALEDSELLRRALDLATESAASGGGPFGALIARDGEIVATGANGVVRHSDPTAHAEVTAIRAACRELGTHDLSGHVLFTSCEPCPMCLGAAYWARVDRVVFAGSRDDAAAAGFDDAHIYEELPKPPAERSLSCEQQLADEGRAPFEAWASFAERHPY